jgi:glutathione S-transferase
MSASSASVTYVAVEQARTMPGLRLAFTRGFPGPWSVAAKAIFDLKGIDYIAVPQEAGGANEALREWTGQTSAPVAMLNDDRPRALWSEILVLAEQLQPEPRLIPENEDDRMTMFGLCHELCADDGLGWNARLLMISGGSGARGNDDNPLRRKYDSPVPPDYVRRRLSVILSALALRLERQAKAGSRYFVGERLTAADIYWAAFSNLFHEMGAELCINPEPYVGVGARICAQLDAPLAQVLIDHREHVVRNYFRTPILM